MMGTEETNLPKLAAPARRALQGAGYTRLEDLTKVTESDVMKLHGMGGECHAGASQRPGRARPVLPRWMSSQFQLAEALGTSLGRLAEQAGHCGLAVATMRLDGACLDRMGDTRPRHLLALVLGAKDGTTSGPELRASAR
jgi:hypothetical protein